MESTEKSLPDKVLVVAAILGDLKAFDELVRRYRAATVRLAQALAGPEDAEDIAQDALLLAFKALPSIEDPTRFAAWLNAITRRRALRWDRSQRARKAQRVAMDDMLLGSLASLSQPLLEKREEEAALQRALAELSEQFSLVLKMHFFDRVPLKRIAAFLGVPVSTIKWRIHRGKKLLREDLTYLEKGVKKWKKKKN